MSWVLTEKFITSKSSERLFLLSKNIDHKNLRVLVEALWITVLVKIAAPCLKIGYNGELKLSQIKTRQIEICRQSNLISIKKQVKLVMPLRVKSLWLLGRAGSMVDELATQIEHLPITNH